MLVGQKQTIGQLFYFFQTFHELNKELMDQSMTENNELQPFANKYFFFQRGIASLKQTMCKLHFLLVTVPVTILA